MFMLFLGDAGTRIGRVERIKTDFFALCAKTDYPIYSAKQNKKSVSIRSIRVIRVPNIYTILSRSAFDTASLPQFTCSLA